MRTDSLKSTRDVFNIRLALDKFVDEWKSRMLFFGLNQDLTIEVLEKKNDEEPKDSLLGLIVGG